MPLLLLAWLGSSASAATLRVGPERNYKRISDVAVVARDGDIILLDGGDYSGDVAKWTQNDLVIWAPDGRARLRADGASSEGKGIWVVEGRNFTAENIEFSGARVPDRNGAGIRLHAKGTVTLRNCYFHHNENGILGDADQVVIDGCVFDRNGAGDGQTHNIYVWGPQVTIRNTYTHRTAVGHNIKTRGIINYILYNKIADEEDGTGSYAIDVPDCGRTYIIGNVIEQGPMSENYDVVSYGAESDKNDLREIYIINNTFVNDGRPDGAFIHCRRRAKVRIVNNIFYGPGTPWDGGDVSAASNYIASSLRNAPRFADPGRYDFHLTPDSPDAILGRGIPPGVSATGFDLMPREEYVEGAKSKARAVGGALDLGAFARASGRTSALDADAPRPAVQRTSTAAPTVAKVSKVSKRKTEAKKSKRTASGTSTPKKTATSSK
jgi:hypothetical protein